MPPAELMVVGDADQSIYAFRGANIRNILDFEQDFPDAHDHPAGAELPLHPDDPDRRQRGHRAQPRPQGEAALVRRRATASRSSATSPTTEHDEARFVADEIDRLTDDGRRAGDVAVFYRTNAQSRVFEEVFIRIGLPYQVVGGVRFYERREVRDALAYLRMLANPDDEVSLRRILNTPKRGIGDRAEAMRRRRSPTASRSPSGRRSSAPTRRPASRPASLNSDPGFVALVTELQSMVDGGERPDVVLESVLDALRLPGRARGVRRPAGRDPGREPRRAGRRRPRVRRRPRRRPERRPGRRRRRPASSRDSSDFLERVALVADSDQIPDATTRRPPTGVVTLMTLHTAKGLEFPVVFLTGLEDGVFPHHGRSATARAGGGAPARLRRHHPRPRSGSTSPARWSARPGERPPHNPPSRFIDELPVDLVDWRRTEADQTRWSRPPRQRRGTSYGAATGSAPRPLPAAATSPRPPRAPTPGEGEARPADPGARAR